MSHGAAGMDPSDVYRYHTRYIPTISIMRHSEILVRTGKHDPNFARRAHDTKIIDDDKPREATQLLLLDLNISKRNFNNHRCVVMSSPYRSCLETATIVAQELGLTAIQVYHDFGEAVMHSRDAGWDFAYEQLNVSTSEMHNIVSEKSQEGVLRFNSEPVTISAVIGTELTVADLNENEVNYTFRVANALDQAVASLEMDGDHVIVIAHGSTIKTAATHFVKDLAVIKEETPCGYMTFATPSDHSAWVAGRSKITLKPVRAKDLTKKILNQLDLVS